MLLTSLVLHAPMTEHSEQHPSAFVPVQHTCGLHLTVRSSLQMTQRALQSSHSLPALLAPRAEGPSPSQQLQQVRRKSQGSVVWPGCWLNATYSQIPTSYKHLRISLPILYTADSCPFNE